LYDACPCGSGKVYRRCCYPRTFPDFSKPNFGLEPHLDQAATMRAYKRLDALPAQQGITIDTVDVGRTRLNSAPLSPVGDSLPGTLAPPTPRQIEAKYDWIRESNRDGVTEVVVTYTYPEMFGQAEARIVFDADERFLLVDGRKVSVLELHHGMSVVMADGSVGTLIGSPERRYDIPVPPLPVENGLWTSRVVGRVKHTAHEVIEFGWGGQTVKVTPGHEVWSADRRGWVWAYELRKGEMIRVGSGVAPAEFIRRVPGLIEVYGIEVEYFHNYFVGTGDNAMLVHNGPQCVVKPAAEGPIREVRVGDLKPLQTPAHGAPRPGLQKLTDAELLQAARNPKNGDLITVNTRTGNLSNGNGRAHELQRRAADPKSSITPDTKVPVAEYTPDTSMFPELP
jgi:hypothetical protein